MSDEITYVTELGSVAWEQMKATLAADEFDNERTPDEWRRSFENSRAVVAASAGGRIVGTARARDDRAAGGAA